MAGTRVRTAGTRRGRILMALVGVLAALGLVVQPIPATAAGTATLTVSATPVHYLTGAPVTEAANGVNGSRAAFRVSYSCSNEDCVNATVKIAPTALDPNYNNYRLLLYSSWTAPVGGGTISGSAAAGYTVNLGTLPVGTSGTFTIVYSWGTTGSYQVNEYSDVAASNFPDGYPLTLGLTGDATTAAAPATATSSPLVWRISTPAPGITSPVNANILTDVDYTYQVRMGTGCMTQIDSKAKGNAYFLCASDYQVRHVIPAGAVFVSATGDYSYDPGTRTITWDAPDWAAPPAKSAAVGWHSTYLDIMRYKTVTLRFPAATFAPSGVTCDFSTPVSFSSAVDVTYISMPGVPGVVKTATDSRTANVRCVTPFPKAIIDPKLSTFDGGSRETSAISLINIPQPGAGTEHYWQVIVGNQSNVDGVAVVTDNSLDLAGAPVTRIEAGAGTGYPIQDGAEIQWTATDGTTTISDVSYGTATAPAGFRFVTAVVTSEPLVGPNLVSTGTARTNFRVLYYYTPTSDAVPEALRTNTATATMSWPGSGLSTMSLGPVSHSIRFKAPFAKATATTKVATGTLTSGKYVVTVPASGSSASNYWGVTVGNQANVPGVAVVTDNALDQPNAPVYQITSAGASGTVAYTLSTGATGTATLPFTLTTAQRDAGVRIVAATVTSGSIDGPNSAANQTPSTSFIVRYYYTISASGTPLGQEYTNTASAVMTYPGYPQLTTVDEGSASATIRFTGTKMNFGAGVVGSPVIQGGGSTATTGTDVTFSLRGSTSSQVTPISPQLVFAAPAGWVITPGSASFPAGTPTPTFTYRTAVIAGVSRQVVVATWPAGTFALNSMTPTMSVVARPTGTLAAGTTSTANIYFGDANHTFSNTDANYSGAFQDAGDLDNDGVATEYFASTSQNVVIGAAGAMVVKKEICSPVDTSVSPDGCQWISNPAIQVGVAPNSTSITYRLTVTNSGNIALSNLVAYDVLPYIGDVGTSATAASTPRGSTFTETVNAVSGLTAGLTVTYSDSTNPCRAEVYPALVAPACVNDWDSTPAGAQALRLSHPGSIAAGASVSMVYTANVVGNPSNGAIACNSVAASVTGIGTVSEPSPVCAAVQEADFALSVPSRLPLQVGRAGVVPFEIVNLGGATEAPAAVSIDVPAGMTVSSLTPAGWSCEASPVGSTAGPLTLTCDSVDGTGQPRAVAKDTPETIALAVVPTAVPAGGSACFVGTVTGAYYDGVSSNNSATACLLVAAAPAVAISKTDALTTVGIGDTYSYTITASNLLVGSPLADVVITDTLPAGLEFVSASDGGTSVAGVVTWPAVTLPQAGTATAGGGAVGATAATITRTVTVRVLPAASGPVVNTATVTAPDPANPSTAVTATATDTDQLRKLAVTKTTNAPTVGILAGDEVTYTVTLTNIGTAAYTSGTPATLTDVLTGVLDDAAYVAGSASITVAGGAPSPVTGPTAGALSWSGPLGVGASAILTYRVTAGAGADKSLVNAAYTSPSGTSCATGLDENGFACATTTTPYAPTIAKSVQSLTHNDDGTWTIVYAIDVANLNETADVTYDITDTLGFGAGIVVDSATVTAVPVGVAASAWEGSGLLVDDAVIAAGAQHHYEVTVVADAGAVGGTAAATCVPGSTGGFGNSLQFSPVGGRPQTAFACASPVEPTVDKAVETVEQNPDGTWSIVYTLTVTGPASAPAGGVAYSLEDEFDFPNGVTVAGVTVAGPAGAPINGAFDGDSDTEVLTSVDRVGAGASRVFTVTVTTEVPAGAVTGADFACPVAGTGGYANAVALFSGSSATELDSADACTRTIAQPTPQVSKSVTHTSIDAVTGYWTIIYDVTVTNPSSEYATTYDLVDELDFGDGITVIGTPLIESTDASPDASWDGVANSSVVTDQPIAASAVDTYTVTVVADTVTVTDANVADMDCLLSAGETGTGFRNVATVASGVASPSFAVGCAAANDPSVVKQTVGSPVQDPTTGMWTLQYQVTVTNRATTSPVGGIPYTLTDTFGFPAGTTLVGDIEVTGPGTINAAFDGDADTELATGSIAPAVDESTPEQHVYTVTVHFAAAGGLEPEVQYCDPAQGDGGLRNEVEVSVGARVTGDVACADSPDVPVAGAGKELLSQTQLADGTWEVLYRITVANPDPSIATVYSLEDEFALGAGIALAAPPTVVANPAGATVNPAWDGDADTTIIEQLLLPGGGSHSYTVRAIIDSGSVRGTDAAGDCTLDAGETGTGFTNTAAALTGASERTASACATAHDPSVTKTVAGEPVRNLDGSFTVAYVVTVQNPSTDVPLAYELTDALDFPTGTVFGDVVASPRADSPATSATWDGVTDTIVVPAGAALAAGATHVFDITVTATLPQEQGSQEGGFANGAVVASSTDGVVTSEDDAAADIEVPELVVTKESDASAVVEIGDTITYTITAENVGEGDYTSDFPAELWDYLGGVLDDATIDGVVTASPNAGAITSEADRFHWSGPLLSGDTVVLTYSVVVTADGDQDLVNVAYAPVLPGQEPDLPGDCEGDRCAETSTPLASFELEKAASTGVVAAGDTVTYTLTYANTGLVDVPDATFTDDLSDVLDDAELDGDVTATTGSSDVAGGVLTWSGSLAAGASVTVTYTVSVSSPLTGDGFLVNTAAADDRFISPEPDVTVTTGIRSLAFTKSSDATRIAVGQTVTYKLTVTNIGSRDYTDEEPALIVDTLTDVLDDAVYNGDASAPAGEFAFTGTSLIWTGPLAAGESIELAYTVTTNSQATGNGALANIVGVEASDDGIAGVAECLAEPTDNAEAKCFVTLPILPLAHTGGTIWIVPLFAAILLILAGLTAVALRLPRRMCRGVSP